MQYPNDKTGGTWYQVPGYILTSNFVPLIVLHVLQIRGDGTHTKMLQLVPGSLLQPYILVGRKDREWAITWLMIHPGGTGTRYRQ